MIFLCSRVTIDHPFKVLCDVCCCEKQENGEIKTNHCVFYSESFENPDLLHDNVVILTLPLRYAVDVNVHG